MLPNFFIVGAQKSGTTSLHHYLKGHPEIYLPQQKETKFFVRDDFYEKGISYYENEYFSEWRGEKALGEVDPDYMYFARALKRIRNDLDITNLKIIFILRNPVERAFSHYLMTYRRGLEPLSFEEAIAEEGKRLKKGFFEHYHFSYVNRGFYMSQLERFLRIMDEKQLLLLLFDDLKEAPQNCIMDICKFLNISLDFVPGNIKQMFHRSTVPKSMYLLKKIEGECFGKKIVRVLMPWEKLRHKLRSKLIELNQTTCHNLELSEETYQRLAGIFHHQNQKLAQFLGRNLEFWENSTTRSSAQHERS